jgi:hypothetical protein
MYSVRNGEQPWGDNEERRSARTGAEERRPVPVTMRAALITWERREKERKRRRKKPTV